MTELQNNDLSSRIWAASPVEPTQSTQINLSDTVENLSQVQAAVSSTPVENVVVQQWNSWVSNPQTIENVTSGVNSAEIGTTEGILTENISSNNEISNEGNVSNNAISQDSTILNKEVKIENTAVEKTNPIQLSNPWALTGNSISKVVNTDSQKPLNVTKKGSKAGFWMWLASGVLISLWLVVLGAFFYDNWSILESVTQSIGLAKNDTTNEVINLEDSIAFDDSLSNDNMNEISGESDEDSDNSELNRYILGAEDIDSTEVLFPTLEDEDEILDEDENIPSIGEEQKEEDEMEVITKNDYLDNTLNDKNSSLNTDKKSDSNSSKNKMAGSIVSIFDDTDNGSESGESEDLESSDETSISYNHVDKVEDANWVMSANCDNLHCGNISEVNLDELVLCTEFRQSDKLDDNSNRIGANWVCRYKDASELVHIEL